MKTHLRVIALVLALALSVSPLATADELSEKAKSVGFPELTRLFTVDEMRLMLEEVFEAISASIQEDTALWYSVIYNDELDLFYIEIAIDGYAEKIFGAIDAGYNEAYAPWVYMKERMLMLYGMLSMLFSMCENEQLTLRLDLVNDTLYFNDEWDIPYYFSLYEIGRNGFVTGDVMKEEEAPMPTRAPKSNYGY